MRGYARVLCGSIVFLLGAVEGLAAESKPAPPLDFIAAGRLVELQRAGRLVRVVDVRTSEEFEVAHIRGAVNIPLKQLERRHREIPRKGLVVLY